jgi:hypothetical protein
MFVVSIAPSPFTPASKALAWTPSHQAGRRSDGVFAGMTIGEWEAGAVQMVFSDGLDTASSRLRSRARSGPPLRRGRLSGGDEGARPDFLEGSVADQRTRLG